MALTDVQQIQKAFEDSNYVLVLFDTKNIGDTAASAGALKTLLEKMKKQVDIVAVNGTVPKNYHFLPHTKDIKPAIAEVQKFVIKVDVSQSPVDTISYDVRDGQLSIYLTPKHGTISKNELRTAQSTFKYDLIITLNTADLESLGTAFTGNTDLFYKTPIINIDHQATNERYGQVNLVDLTSTSTAEVIYKTLKKIYADYIDAPIANALLTGMTAATKGFRNYNITPFTLQLASELITYGADREMIVQHLYRTRSMATLKLWGQALTHLEHDTAHNIVWSTLTREDFTRSGATQEDLYGIIDELIGNSPEAKIIALMYETGEKTITAIVATEKNYNALDLTKTFASEGTPKTATVRFVGKTLKEAEVALLTELRAKLV